MMKTSNILDPIHETLDSSVFDDPSSDEPVLKEQHRKWIIHEIVTTLSDHGYTHINDWLSLVLTGSLTTYQYSEDSDVDVSLFVDSKHFPEWSRAEMIGIMVDKIDGTKLPGTAHPMQCFVVPPQVTKESLYSPGLRSGYDLLKKEWVQPPERERAYNVEQEQNADYVFALECADKMERLLRYEPDKAVDYWHQIHHRRRRDHSKGKGDFAQSNIVYKFLANRGLFDSIAEASGEYIAKTADAGKTKLIYKKFQPTVDHGKGPAGPELPFIYVPEHDTVYLGPPGAYHHDLIASSKALKEMYDPDKAWKEPAGLTPEGVDHVHGRMSWPEKILHVIGTPDEQYIPRIEDALEATYEPVGNKFA
jgi:hypothetical protein